jgi:hypothetical protein
MFVRNRIHYLVRGCFRGGLFLFSSSVAAVVPTIRPSPRICHCGALHILVRFVRSRMDKRKWGKSLWRDLASKKIILGRVKAKADRP